MIHPNVEVLKKLYDAFQKNDLSAMFEVCSDDVTFQIAGKSKLAGKYSKATIASGLFSKIAEMSAGTFKADIHDITATDLHGMVLMTNTLVRAGYKQEYRTVHVWRFQNGKPLAGYEYLRDMYQYDGIWS